MTELEMLQREVEKLQKTVALLQQGTLKVETSQAKLVRLKNEIVVEVVLSKLPIEVNSNQLCEFRKNVSIVANDIWQMQTGIEKPGFEKMHKVLLECQDSEERLASYLAVFRNVCEFMATQYEGHWKKKVYR